MITIETELLNELLECIRICERLEDTLAVDREEIPQAVSGAVQREYTAGLDATLSVVGDIKKRLYLLQDECMLIL